MPPKKIKIDFKANVSIKFCPRTGERYIQIDTPPKTKLDKRVKAGSNISTEN